MNTGFTKTNKNLGFTLFETIVTLAILSIVVAIGFVSYLSYNSKSYVVQFQNFLAEVATKQGTYYHDNRKYLKQEELNIFVPTSIIEGIWTFNMQAYTDSNGKPAFAAVIVPNYDKAIYNNIYPLVINSKEERYFSKNVLCESLKPTDTSDVLNRFCGNPANGFPWVKKEGVRKPIDIAGLIAGTVAPPQPMTGVNNACAYAISLRNKDLFYQLKCDDNLNWPYSSPSSPPISDACLDAYNSGNRTEFAAKGCCSQATWISKATAKCTTGGGVQPTSPLSYTAPESAGQLKVGGKLCLQADSALAGAKITFQTCSTNPTQRYYRGDDGLWHLASDPSLCMTSSLSHRAGNNDSGLTACNPNDKWQQLSYDPSTGRIKDGNGYCINADRYMFSTVGTAAEAWGCGHAGQATSATDTEGEFAINPACLTAINAKDYNTFNNSECCSLGGWPGGDIACPSKPISLPSGPENAKRLEFSPGWCLRPETAGPPTAGTRVAEWPCGNTINDNTNNWYTDENGLLRNATNPNLCLQTNGTNNTGPGGLTLVACDPGNANQKFSTLGGQIRNGAGQCITASSYRNAASTWVGPYQCSGSTNDFSTTPPPTNPTTINVNCGSGSQAGYTAGNCNSQSSADGNYGNAGNWQLPTTYNPDAGNKFTFSCGSSWSCTVKTPGTNMTANKVLTTGKSATFIYNKTTGIWELQP